MESVQEGFEGCSEWTLVLPFYDIVSHMGGMEGPRIFMEEDKITDPGT
jgi:hypothetical protein